MAAPVMSKLRQFLIRLHRETRLIRRLCQFDHGTRHLTATSFTDRTHLCGELRPQDVGKSVTLCGWLQFHRLSGTFLILRDWKGLVQLILPQHEIDALRNLSLESVIKITGEVKLRPTGQENKSMSTGTIEVAVDEIEVLNSCNPILPFEMKDFNQVKESLRIKHRYLNLRLTGIQENLRLRSKFVMAVRQFLANNNEFVEVETPTLFRRTPGGAREFIVPTHFPGKFYCLPQSPQQFKQLLMVGGLDRYFQIAKCYRDETARPDRQPEFTQVDLEMSFVSKDNVLALVEKMLERTWPEQKGHVQGPFPRMSYQQAMSQYGIDKPDTRFDWQMMDVTDLFRQNIPPVFQAGLEHEGATIQALRIPGACKHLSNSEINTVKQRVIEKFQDNVKMVSSKIKDTIDWGSGLGRHLDDRHKHSISEVLNHLQSSDLVIFACGVGFQPNTVLGQARLQFATALESKGVSVRRQELSFLWVDDFPLFLPKENGGGGIESAHHPFTAPHPEDVDLLYSFPEKVRGLHFDLVLNGAEIGGGSIRIHNSSMQRYVLNEILQVDSTELDHLLEALDSGCPPHGGIALGLDRLMAIMCGASSIRDVIAFPKITDGKDPMSNAPAPVSASELEYYHIVPKEYAEE